MEIYEILSEKIAHFFSKIQQPWPILHEGVVSYDYSRELGGTVPVRHKYKGVHPGGFGGYCYYGSVQGMNWCEMSQRVPYGIYFARTWFVCSFRGNDYRMLYIAAERHDHFWWGIPEGGQAPAIRAIEIIDKMIELSEAKNEKPN